MVLASCGSSTLSNEQKVKVQTCTVHICSSHANIFHHSLLLTVTFKVLTKS